MLLQLFFFLLINNPLFYSSRLLAESHAFQVGARALVLSPTRELALQTLKFVQLIGKYLDLRACLLVGGDAMEDQFTDLALNPDM